MLSLKRLAYICCLLIFSIASTGRGEETISIPSNRSEMDEKIRLMVERGKAQPRPLKRSGEVDEQFEKFFEVMATLWHIADEYDLTHQIQFTNFVTFGPQSAGKTTITERILGFPVAVTKTGVGTTRPMILTTRRSDVEQVRVKAYGEEAFREYDREKVMVWAQTQMEDAGTTTATKRPKISNKPIYIDVTGPKYMNRRFVDLPGFQANDEGNAGTRQAILNLLKEEMDKPNTVVLCVEDSQLEYVNSPLVLAIKQVFGTSLMEQPSFQHRFVIAFNKSDRWLLADDISKESFVNRLYPYVQGCGIMPIIVGTPFNPSGTVRRDRETGSASFSEVEDEYRHAISREEGVYRSFFNSVDVGQGMEDFLRSKFLGFENLLGTVDGLVVERDLGNFERISKRLKRIIEQTSRSIERLEVQLELLSNLRENSKSFLTDLLYDVKKIATTDAGGSPVLATIDIDDIKVFGNDALTEEIEFVFGHRNPNATYLTGEHYEFGGYYDPTRTYRDQSSHGLDHANVGMWTKEIFKTITRLKSPQTVNSIDYLHKELVGGKLYERAVAVWSSSLYSYLAPTHDDLLRLANIVGTNTEIKDPNRHDFLKATRLMEVYVMRLVPALQYLCQKLEFLLLKIFDTAWRARLKMGSNKELVELIGESSFRAEARARFRDSVRQSSAIAYGTSLTDLNNDVNKLLPYSTDSAAVSGMLFAFPDAADNIVTLHNEYRNVFANAVKKKVTQHMSEIFASEGLPTVLKGIEDGIDIIATAGSIDPLLIAGLGTCRDMVASTWKGQRSPNRPSVDERMEDRDERLLGFTCVLYSHFLPRFIATIDSRMRRELWGSVDDTRAIEAIRDAVLDSSSFKRASLKVGGIQASVDALKVKELKLREAYDQLTDMHYRFEGYLPNDDEAPVCHAFGC